MQFVETRGNDGTRAAEINFSDAILDPGASYGGLYVPESLPALDRSFLEEHAGSHYKRLAADFLDRFDIDIEPSTIAEALDRYDAFDDPANPVPLVQIEEDCHVCELYHGQTRAFKDMALQPFGYILSRLAQERGENYLIMAATSGDTGPATLDTFKNQPNIKVACLYPDGGTSDVQRLQMVTEDGENLKVIGLKGNFDDAQSSLKSLLASKDFREELKRRQIKLSAANSVNFGRIIFQIIYHIHSYLELIRREAVTLGDEVYMVVPSGNFGNALGAYYAKKAGLPIKKILIASNINNILTDWITTGIYDISERQLIQTESPAMDILKSSNIERVLYDKYGAERTRELLESLDKSGKFVLRPDELESLREDFEATFSSDEEGEAVIADYARKGYIMDPHTATCLKAYRTLREEKIPSIIYSTAEWTKFSMTVSRALGHPASDDLDALKWVSETNGVRVPDMISALFEKPIRHNVVVEQEMIEEEMLKFL